MKIGILSRAPSCYSTQRLIAAAKEHRHHAQVIDPLRCCVELGQGGPDLTCRGESLHQFAAVIPRVGFSVAYYSAAVIRHLEQSRICVANGSSGIAASHDLIHSYQLLREHQVPVPETTFLNSRLDCIDAIERIGGLPVVLRVIECGRSVGVVLADTTETVNAVLCTVQTTKQTLMIQRHIRGSTIRAIVVGDQVVGATRRIDDGEWLSSHDRRSNSVQPIALENAYCETAVRAAEVMRLQVAGVELLDGHAGPMVIGVNSSPGLQKIELATKTDLAGAIVNYVVARHGFPDLQLRSERPEPVTRLST